MEASGLGVGGVPCSSSSWFGSTLPDALLDLRDLHLQLCPSGPHLKSTPRSVDFGFSAMQVSPDASSGAQPPPADPWRSSLQRLFARGVTYLARLAVVLQAAPGKMLTFTQLTDVLMPTTCEDKRSIENILRVCLSVNECFVKVQRDPRSLTAKRNYWKLDTSKISEKMARRHFRRLLEFFPELASKAGAIPRRSRTSGRRRSLPEHEAYIPGQFLPAVKSGGPVSTDVLLTRSGPSAGASRPSPLSAMQDDLQQQHPPSIHGGSDLLQASAGSSSVWPAGGSTHQGLYDDGLIDLIDELSEISFPSGTSAAPDLTSPPSSVAPSSAPAFSLDALLDF